MTRTRRARRSARAGAIARSGAVLLATGMAGCAGGEGNARGRSDAAGDRGERAERGDGAGIAFEAEDVACWAESAAGERAGGPRIVEAECASGRAAVAIEGPMLLRVRASRARTPEAAGNAAGDAGDAGLAGVTGDADGAGRGALWLRVSCHGDSRGAELEVVVGDGRATKLRVADSLHRERFEWVRACEVDGDADVRASAGAEGATLLLDRIAVVPLDRAPVSDWAPAVWRADGGSLELRAAAGASVFDPAWILRVLREQRDVVASRLGARLARPLVLIAVPASRWKAEGSGALQDGCAIVLRDDELHLPWRSYAHEIVHLHEDELVVKRGSGWRLPWFLSEGVACALALEVERAILGGAGPVEAKERRLDRLLQAGDASFTPGSGRNELLFVRADPPEPDRRAAAYAWSTAVVRAAAARGGEGFGRRLHALVAADVARVDAPADLDVAWARGVLERTAGGGLDGLWRDAGLVGGDDGSAGG